MEEIVLSDYILIAMAGILFGTITVSAQLLTNMGLSLYEISVYTTIFSLLLLTPLIISRKYLLQKDEIRFFLIYGLIQSLLQIFQMGGVVLGVPVAVVAFLLYTQPIYTTILGKVMMSEEVNRRKIIALSVAIFGIFVLLKPWDITSIGNLLGIFSSLLGGVFLSLWVIYGRIGGLEKKHSVKFTFYMFLFSFFWLLLFAPILSLTKNDILIKFVSYPLKYWMYFAVISFVAFVLPITLFYKGIQRVPASSAGIIMLLEPVSATIIAGILFGQKITVNIIFGGFLILLSNYIVVTG